MFAYNGMISKINIEKLKVEQAELSKKILAVMEDIIKMRADITKLKEENHNLKSMFDSEIETHILDEKIFHNKDKYSATLNGYHHTQCACLLTIILLAVFSIAFINDTIFRNQTL